VVNAPQLAVLIFIFLAQLVLVRLKGLGKSSLMVDKEARLGGKLNHLTRTYADILTAADNWRLHYKYLFLHDPVWANRLGIHDDDSISRSTSRGEGDSGASASTPFTSSAVPLDEADDLWLGWNIEDKFAIDEAGQFDDVVGFLEEQTPKIRAEKQTSGSVTVQASFFHIYDLVGWTLIYIM
jgi:hypothetical protein